MKCSVFQIDLLANYRATLSGRSTGWGIWLEKKDHVLCPWNCCVRELPHYVVSFRPCTWTRRWRALCCAAFHYQVLLCISFLIILSPMFFYKNSPMFVGWRILRCLLWWGWSLSFDWTLLIMYVQCKKCLLNWLIKIYYSICKITLLKGDTNNQTSKI